VIELYLGTVWLPAMNFCAWLCALLASQVTQTPLSAASTTLRLQQGIMWQQAGHLIFRLAGFVVGANIFASSLGGVAGYSIAGVLVNFAFDFLVIRMLLRSTRIKSQ
jgi:hypothetical protein